MFNGSGKRRDVARRAARGRAAADAGMDDVPFVSVEDEEFVSGKDEETDGAVYLSTPRSTRRSRRSSRSYRDRAQIPIERPRRDSGSDDEVRIVDVLRTLFRHRWLMAVVIGVSVASAVAYNYASPCRSSKPGRG